MKTQRRIATHIQEAIEALTVEGLTPPEIHRRMKNRPDAVGRVPTLRTVQRVAKEATPSDESGPWSLIAGDPGDAALVLPVLAAVIERTKGRRTEMSGAVAERVARIRRAAPDLHPWVVYSLAVAYLAAEERETDTAPLDAFLAFTPWKDDEHFKRHHHAVKEGWVRETWGLFAAYAGEAGHPLGRLLAAVEAGTVTLTVGDPPSSSKK